MCSEVNGVPERSGAESGGHHHDHHLQLHQQRHQQSSTAASSMIRHTRRPSSQASNRCSTVAWRSSESRRMTVLSWVLIGLCVVIPGEWRLNVVENHQSAVKIKGCLGGGGTGRMQIWHWWFMFKCSMTVSLNCLKRNNLLKWSIFQRCHHYVYYCKGTSKKRNSWIKGGVKLLSSLICKKDSKIFSNCCRDLKNM